MPTCCGRSMTYIISSEYPGSYWLCTVCGSKQSPNRQEAMEKEGCQIL